MAKPLVSDELWELIRPLLPAHEPSPKGGRPRLQDRACLTGILFVLKTGIGWEALPAEMGCGSGMTCWRRLRDWHRAGVFRRLHRRLLGRMREAGCLDFTVGIADSASVRAVHGEKTGKSPVDRRKTGSKHLLTDTRRSPASATSDG